MGWFDSILRNDSYYRSAYDSGIKSFWSWLQSGYGLDITTLGSRWWSLSLAARKTIGKKIIDTYCKAMPSELKIRAKNGAPWITAYCLGRAILQCSLLDNMGRYPDLWLAEWNCWGQPRSYFPTAPVEIKLPVTCVTVICEAKNWYHAVSALQIENDVSKITSWIFFQGRTGILPVDGSNSQIPHGSTVTMRTMDSNLISYNYTGFGPKQHDGNITLAVFNIP